MAQVKSTKHAVKGVREKRPGVWEVRLHVSRDPATGKNRQVSRTVRAPRTRGGHIPAAVTDALARLRTEVADGLHDPPPEPERVPDVITLGQLLDDWLAHGESVGRSPATLDGYRRKIDVHIRPALGSIPLTELKTADVDRWYGMLRRNGTSPATIVAIHRILSAALRQAIKWESLETSPTTNATPPSVPRKELTVPPPTRVRALIEMAETSKSPEMATVIVLATMTGLRRGELSALRWADVDFQRSIITVRRSIWQTQNGWGLKDPKSHQIRRLILGPHAIEVLRRRRQRVDTVCAAIEVDLAGDAYVLSNEPDGSAPILPGALTQAFARLIDRMERKTGEPWPYRFHDLRHYAATELFRAGVNPRTVADRLGHADPSITLRVYVSDTEDQARAAAVALEAGLLDRLDST